MTGASPKPPREACESPSCAAFLDVCARRAGAERVAAAAATIQRAYRCYTARRNVCNRRTLKWCRVKNAMTIQRAFRCAIARRALSARRAECARRMALRAAARQQRYVSSLVELIYWHGAATNDAATRIQRWFRAKSKAREVQDGKAAMFEIVSMAKRQRDRVLAFDEREAIAALSGKQPRVQ